MYITKEEKLDAKRRWQKVYYQKNRDAIKIRSKLSMRKLRLKRKAEAQAETETSRKVGNPQI